MNIETLTSILGNNTLSYSYISMASMANIMNYVNVKLQMDRSSLDYYYEISVNELVNSNINEDEIKIMQTQGWSFNNDKSSLILYIKSN